MLSLKNTIHIFLLYYVLFSNGKSDVKAVKQFIVEKIVEKIFNITSQALENANPEEKDDIMKKIENKLIKSAEPLGNKSDKYIRLIMQGLQIMAHNRTFKQNDPNIVTADTHSNLRRTNNSEVLIETGKKDNAAQDLANKILKLAEKYFKKAEKSSVDKVKIMENIKDKVLETAKQRHDLIHVKHDEIKKYTDLISRGMELMIQKMSHEPNKRRMVMEFVNGFPKKEIEEDETTIARNNKHNIMYKEYKEDFVLSTKSTPVSYNDGLTTPISCDEVFHNTCADIKSLNEFVCKTNRQTVPLRSICNGVTDCADGSDEGDCVTQAMDRLQSATGLMSQIENFLLRNCFLSDDNSLLIKQNTVLYEVLQHQMQFINKYKNMNRNTIELTNAYSFKRTLNEVIIVINTLALALDSSLCIRYMNEKKAEEESRKFNPLDADDLDELTEAPVPVVSLRSCVCSGSFCANRTCAEACSRVCWHKYNMGRWICQAIDEGSSVTLDMVCDGKLDCYDETDETGCRTDAMKFEANELFDLVLKLLNSKTNKNQYSAVRNKLIALGNAILQLQKIVLKPKPNALNIKNVRDICYASIISIYEDIIGKTHDIKQLDDTHMFLLTLSERLMSALKLSHTGNDRIITPDGCYCRGDRCAALKCTPACKRACAVNTKLTRYWCKSTVSNNISIPIRGICNGVPNCPFEDDESHCIFDVCRKHHLILLRHNIRDVGEKQKGTALGEALLSWKAKVISTVKIAENNYRPTPNSLRDLVEDMLHDLVLAYASLNDTRRASTDHVLKEFADVAELMIEGLKSCGK